MINRINRVFKKARNGEPITVAFLGGSITQGCLSSVHETCYAYLTYDWFVKNFSSSNVTYVNAGIGGTTSQYGVARVENHVLSKNPDMVFVEFSVNDSDIDFFKETYEGLIRRIYNYECAPAIMIIHNIKYDDGVSAERIHHELAEYYKIPSVSMKSTIYKQMLDEGFHYNEITADGLHPNDKGHKMVSDIICAKLEELLADGEKNNFAAADEEYDFPEQVTENLYVNSKLYQADDCTPVLNGFERDTREKKEFLDIFSKGWIGKKVGDEIVFDFDCASISVQYKKTIKKPAPICSLILDDDNEHPFILDANFEEDWGDELHIDNILVHGEKKKHTIKIRVDQIPDGAISDFYLVSMIVA